MSAITTYVEEVDEITNVIQAYVRLDTDNWTGHHFTDFFNLVKIDGQWKILGKVFYLHP